MAIIDQDDIEAVFGDSNVAAWSNLENDSTAANTARITAAITYAEATFTNRLRDSRYVVPLVPLSGTHDPEVVDICAKLAGVWLYESRGIRDSEASEVANRIVTHRRYALQVTDLILAGTRRIPYTEKERVSAVAAAI